MAMKKFIFLKKQTCQAWLRWPVTESTEMTTSPLDARSLVWLELGVFHHFRVQARVDCTSVDSRRQFKASASQEKIFVDDRTTSEKTRFKFWNQPSCALRHGLLTIRRCQWLFCLETLAVWCLGSRTEWQLEIWPAARRSNGEEFWPARTGSWWLKKLCYQRSDRRPLETTSFYFQVGLSVQIGGGYVTKLIFVLGVK